MHPSATIRPQDGSYRPDIDGLRAIAVGLVLVFHAASDRLPGGYLGVDVFFVVSGFLITGIILRRLEGSTFSLAAFYIARVRRLYPALLVVLAATLVLGWFVFTTSVYQGLGKQGVASAAFVANVYFLLTTNYFRPGDDSVLLHLWSLGVEEQYYLVWPILLMGAARLPRQGVLWLALAIFAASFLYNIQLTATSPTTAFFSPLTRSWELMAGAILACLPPRVRLQGWSAHFLSALALTMLAIASLRPAALAVCGLTTPAAVLAAGLLLLAPGAWPNRALLASRPVVLVGLISYPLYLWHWPILSALSAVSFGVAPPLLRLAGLLASVVLAYLTYRYVEQSRLRERTGLLIGGMIITALLFAAVALTGFPERAINRDPRHAFVERFADPRPSPAIQAAYGERCSFYDWSSATARETIPADCSGVATRRTWVLWGDSHAQALNAGVEAIAPPGTQFLLLASSDCRPSIDPPAASTSASGVACARSNRHAMAVIGRLRPEVVLLAQKADHEGVDWSRISRWLKARGTRHVVLIGPAPHWYPSLPAVIARSHWADRPTRIATGLFAGSMMTDAALGKKFGQSKELRFVSLIGSLCDRSGCLAQVPGGGPDEIMAIDYAHLSPAGSRYVGRTIIAPALAQELARP